MTAEENKLFARAWNFAAFICIYNVLEGIVDESLTLFGFGFDSFIEVASTLVYCI